MLISSEEVREADVDGGTVGLPHNEDEMNAERQSRR